MGVGGQRARADFAEGVDLKTASTAARLRPGFYPSLRKRCGEQHAEEAVIYGSLHKQMYRYSYAIARVHGSVDSALFYVGGHA